MVSSKTLMLRYRTTTRKEPKKTFAKKLRAQHTSGEKILWRKLRAKRFHGLKFRRQVPIGPYIVDFLCAPKRLIIEIDGDSHFQEGAQARDQKREAFLRGQGYSILRFGNWQTVHETERILECLGRELGCYRS